MAVQTDLSWQERSHAISWAVEQGFDALAIADLSLALYCATHYPSIPLHIIAPADICPRTAHLLKLQVNAARILVPHYISLAQLAAICANVNAEIEVSAAGPVPGQMSLTCNDPCYLAEQGTRDALLRLPLLASIGVHAIQVEPRSDMPDDVANMAYTWKTAIDRCHAAGPNWQGGFNMM
ncbi:hypothetical protein AYR66_25215 [Noviherbaspirillum denitrificans]|uniref:Xylose isomerase-like TIM barrel domain-containing protein n=2 Tax=Noviherbaspirillum denitrificans TaxID=1968433 RepID=A0A254TLS9_9BURK|nr:hypothetical protein AYR66_25215 [Noviherbaspirillum denitrificans]